MSNYEPTQLPYPNDPYVVGLRAELASARKVLKETQQRHDELVHALRTALVRSKAAAGG